MNSVLCASDLRRGTGGRGPAAMAFFLRFQENEPSPIFQVEVLAHYSLPEGFLGALLDLFGAPERSGVVADRLWICHRRRDRLPSLSVTLRGQQGVRPTTSRSPGITFGRR